jgi:hypothetical protein
MLAVAALAGPTPAIAQSPDPTTCGTEDGTGCAPPEARVDLVAPTFSAPTPIANPLHPSSELRSGVLLGREEGRPLRVEITLMPEPKLIELDGTTVPALESQYVAFIDGRIAEVALDWFAQADDGAVWYLGEDVFNYEDGVVADTEGTWQAGRDGAPPAMIMPADPQVGDVYRPENAPGVVFEEVTVTRTGLEVAGPGGLVSGAIEVDELHMDGTHEQKVFAPGYGEFSTGSGKDIEALALAVPTDALAGPVPAELTALEAQARAIAEAAAAGDWRAARQALGELTVVWQALRAGPVPLRIEAEMDRAVEALITSVRARRPLPAREAAIAVARLGLDLELRHRETAEVDRDRFALWIEQLAVDVAAEDEAAVRSDVTVLEWTRDRFAASLDEAARSALDAGLAELRSAADDGDLIAAGEAAAALAGVVGHAGA